MNRLRSIFLLLTAFLINSCGSPEVEASLIGTWNIVVMTEPNCPDCEGFGLNTNAVFESFMSQGDQLIFDEEVVYQVSSGGDTLDFSRYKLMGNKIKFDHNMQDSTIAVYIEDLGEDYLILKQQQALVYPIGGLRPDPYTTVQLMRQ